MPGYNVEAPAAAFSNTLEDYLAKRQAEAVLQQRMQMEQQRAMQQAEATKQQLALHQQQLEQSKAEFADRVHQRKLNEFKDTISSMQPGDIPSADIVQQGQQLGKGHLFEAPKESMPGIAAVPLVTATDNGQQVLPVEASAQQGITPTNAAMRFKGLPAQQQAAQHKQEVEALMQDVSNAEPGSPEARKALIRYGMVTGKPLTAAEVGTMGGAVRVGTPPQPGSFSDYVSKLAPNGDTSKLTPTEIEAARAKWTGLSKHQTTSTDEDLIPQAVAYNTIGSPSMQGIGMSQETKDRIISVAGKIRRGEIEIPDNAPNFLAKSADYKALQTAYNSQTKMSTAAQTSARAAYDSLDLALESAGKLPVRTDVKFINNLVNGAIRNASPGAELSDFETKIYTAVREYAKVASGSSASVAGLSDSATKEAERLLNSAQSPAAFKAATDAMKQDIQVILNNHDKTLAMLSDRIKTLGQPQSSTAPTAGTNKPGPQGVMVDKDGNLYVNGKKVD